LRLRSSTAQVRHGVSYRVLPGTGRYVLQIKRDSKWENMYRFSLEPHAMSDFEEMCGYQQTSPDSPFSSRRFCALARLNGRVTLADRRLRCVEGTAVEERDLEGDEALAEALREHFGIVP
jgi:N-hydroxyarylamine O-acetyltransferase